MTTIDKTEIEKFSKLAKDWWNPEGKFRPLHLFNPVRIKFIKEKLIYHFKLNSNKEKPLEKLRILDIGSGGGLLCEPLYRLGANVTGVDASDKNIEVAKLHAKQMDLNIKYIHSSPENINLKNEFDVILCMEVVEHVSNINLFIEKCSKLVKKNGVIFISTINKNLKSYAFAIIGAEYILRWLPIGTHDWNKFIKPEELEKKLSNKKFATNNIQGLEFNPIFSKWKKSDNLSVNYIICSSKN